MTNDDKTKLIFQTEESYVTIHFSKYNWIYHKHVWKVISIYTVSGKSQKALSKKIILHKVISHMQIPAHFQWLSSHNKTSVGRVMLMQLLGFKTYSLHIPTAPHEKDNSQGKVRWFIPVVHIHLTGKAFLNFKTSVHQKQWIVTREHKDKHGLLFHMSFHKTRMKLAHCIPQLDRNPIFHSY